MPLVIMCGIPSSGKTKYARELMKELNERKMNVCYISEAEELVTMNMSKDECYNNSNNEKQFRAGLKAKVLNLLNQQTTVILDSSNYIKGYRYELYCASKSCKTTQITIYTIINIDKARELNESRNIELSDVKSDVKRDITELSKSIENSPYSKSMFDALVLRFEEPNSQNRWDSPLFTLQFDEKLNIEDVCKALYERKAPPPNMSTQNIPLSSTNFLYDLDKTIQDICKQVLENKKINPHSEMYFPAYPSAKLDAESMQAAQPATLQRLRRQFLTFVKLQYSNHNPTEIGALYIQYLNTNLKI